MISYAKGRHGRLAFEVWGDPRAKPIFLLHGTPGSRLGPRPRRLALDLMNVCLVTYDRPGYGSSDRHSGRIIADAAQDVADIADQLDIKQFAVVGRSGGGPHALACAARFPDRVTRVASLVGFAPRAATGLGLNWEAGMSAANVRSFGLASDKDQGPALEEELSKITQKLARATDYFDQFPHEELPIADRRVLGDAGIRKMLAENFRQALPGGTQPPVVADGPLAGWLDDTIALSEGWGFDLQEIDVPVLLWHGEDDVFTPVAHCYWLAGQIAQATVVVKRRAAHLGAVTALPDILRWLTRED